MNKFVKKTYSLEDFTHEEKVKSYFKTAYGFVCFENVNKLSLVIGNARGTGEVYVRKTTSTTSSSGAAVLSSPISDFEQLDGALSMTQYSIGPQLGAKLYSQIIFFETERDLKNFVIVNMNTNKNNKDNSESTTASSSSSSVLPMKSNNGVYEFGVDANIVALVASAGANVSTIGNETLSTRVNYNNNDSSHSDNNKDGTEKTTSSSNNRYNYEFRLNDTLAYNKGLAVFTITICGLMFETCFSGQQYKYQESVFASTTATAQDDDKSPDNEEYVFASTEAELSTQTTTKKDDRVKEDQPKIKDTSSSSNERTASTSPLSGYVENLQKFAFSMKNQLVEKVEQVQTKKDKNTKKDETLKTTEKTSSTDINTNTNTDGDSSNNTTSSSIDSIEYSRPFKSGLKSSTEHDTATATIGMAPAAPGETVHVH